MQVTQTSEDGLTREFKVVVAAQDIENRVLDRLEALKQSVRMPGFRPGKVPVALLRKQYGQSILGEILEQALSQSSSQALAEHGLRPAMQPKIEVISFDEGEDLEYTMAVELMPDIVLGDFREIKLTRETAEAGDHEIDSAIERLAEREKSFVPITEDRPARKGDALLIDFVGVIDGVPFEGGSGTDHVLELGSNSFIEGFEDQLIGARAGDQRTVNLTFPAEYVNDELAGKDSSFDVEIKEIQKIDPVSIDDAFAQSLGFADLAALRVAVKEQIERDYDGLSRAKLKRALLDVLHETHDFPVPPGMVDIEFDAIWQRLNEDRANDRLDPDDADRSDEELKAEYRLIAERRVRLGLLLSEVGRLNNIEVGQDELNRAIMERARAFAGQESQVVNYYRENPEAVNELRAPLFEDKVVDFVLEMAAIEGMTVSIEELLRDPDEAKAEAKKAKPKAKKASKTPAKSKTPTKKPAKKPAKKTTKKAGGDAESN